MLRSLVGSEMCIRDSRKHDTILMYSKNFPNITFNANEVLEDRKLTESSICLLYTSDAADDLLCVDLGGRRIIKKKKTNI